jgi:hypothetical protein
MIIAKKIRDNPEKTQMLPQTQTYILKNFIPLIKDNL